MDWLAVGNLIGNLAVAGGNIANPYFYTEQEKAADGLAGGQLSMQQQAIAAQAAAAQQREATNQKAITYGFAGVLGLSCVYLASRLIGK